MQEDAYCGAFLGFTNESVVTGKSYEPWTYQQGSSVDFSAALMTPQLRKRQLFFLVLQ